MVRQQAGGPAVPVRRRCMPVLWAVCGGVRSAQSRAGRACTSGCCTSTQTGQSWACLHLRLLHHHTNGAEMGRRTHSSGFCEGSMPRSFSCGGHDAPAAAARCQPIVDVSRLVITTFQPNLLTPGQAPQPSSLPTAMHPFAWRVTFQVCMESMLHFALY